MALGLSSATAAFQRLSPEIISGTEIAFAVTGMVLLKGLGWSSSRATSVGELLQGGCACRAGLCPAAGPSIVPKSHLHMWLMSHTLCQPPGHAVLCCVEENYGCELGSQVTKCTLFVTAAPSRGSCNMALPYAHYKLPYDEYGAVPQQSLLLDKVLCLFPALPGLCFC